MSRIAGSPEWNNLWLKVLCRVCFRETEAMKGSWVADHKVCVPCKSKAVKLVPHPTRTFGRGKFKTPFYIGLEMRDGRKVMFYDPE